MSLDIEVKSSRRHRERSYGVAGLRKLLKVEPDEIFITAWYDKNTDTLIIKTLLDTDPKKGDV